MLEVSLAKETAKLSINWQDQKARNRTELDDPQAHDLKVEDQTQMDLT